MRVVVSFYERAFEAQRDHVDEDGSYGEAKLEDLRVGFVANWHAEKHLGIPFQPNDLARPPAGFEIFLEVSDVDVAFDRATSAGAIPVAAPEQKPWGLRVAYVRDLDGVIVEMGSDPGS